MEPNYALKFPSLFKPKSFSRQQNRGKRESRSYLGIKGAFNTLEITSKSLITTSKLPKISQEYKTTF